MAKRVSLQGKGVELFFGGAPRETIEPEGGSAALAPRRRPSNGSSNARTRARVLGRADTYLDEESLFKGLGEKQRLASSTFRFQPDELEQLDAVFDELNHARPRRISKNDLVRLGLRWLLSDYAANSGHSLVGKLLTRV